MKKLLFLLLLACGLAHAESSVPDLTAEQWQEDLDFLANEIATRHRDSFHFAGKGAGSTRPSPTCAGGSPR